MCAWLKNERRREIGQEKENRKLIDKMKRYQETVVLLEEENTDLKKTIFYLEEQLLHSKEERNINEQEVKSLNEEIIALNGSKNFLQEQLERAKISERNKEQEVKQVNQMKNNLEEELRLAKEKEARQERENVWLEKEHVRQEKEIWALKKEKSKYQEEVMKVKQDKVSGQEEMTAQWREEKHRYEETLTQLMEEIDRYKAAVTQLEQSKTKHEKIFLDMKEEIYQKVTKLRQEKDSQQQQVMQLKEENVHQQEVIGVLKSKYQEMMKVEQDKVSGQEEMAAQWREEKHRYEEMLTQLTEKRDRDQETLTLLKEFKARQEEIILHLKEKNDQYEEEVTKLRQEKDNQQKQVLVLVDEKAKYEETIKHLRRRDNAQQKEMSQAMDEMNRCQEEALRHKMDEEAVLKVKNEDKVSGLPNLGNTGYINSVVQCLYHLPALRKCLAHCLKEHALNPQLVVNQSSESHGRVALALSRMFKAMSQGKDIHQTMENFMGVIASLDEMFAGNEPQEAQDFLCSLLSWLHNDLSKDTSSAFASEQKSPISSLFHGVLHSLVTCPQRRLLDTITSETFNSLSLSVGLDRCTLEELLAHYFREQTLEWDCQHCLSSHQCLQRTGVQRCPRVLVIHFNRYGRGSCCSCKTRVTYPETGLTLQPHVTRNIPRSPRYQLVGIVHHCGSNMNGHYTSYCRGATDRSWRLCNNESVVSVSLEEVLKLDGAHLLFYLQQEE